jgi:hypothetical protein
VTLAGLGCQATFHVTRTGGAGDGVMCCTSLRPAVRTVAGSTSGTEHARCCGTSRAAARVDFACAWPAETRSTDCVQWACRSPPAFGAAGGGSAAWLPCEGVVAADAWAPWATSGSQQTTQTVASAGATESTTTSKLVSTLRR